MTVALVFLGLCVATWLLSLVWNPFSYDRDVLKWKQEQERKHEQE